MKKLYFLFLTLSLSFASFGQTTVFSESFETGNSGTPSETCNDGTDFFTRTDGSDVNSYTVNGVDGSFFFAAQDTDGAPCTLDVETLTFTGIDITGNTNMTLAILVAEDDSSDGNEDWDADTNVVVEINIDGGGYTNLLQFSGGGATNTEPGLDTNFDGTADTPLLTDTFQEFTAAISGTGSSADLRITFNNLDAGDEDIAIDNIRIIEGFVATPTISLTAPTASTVFAPGTSSVNVEWNTANLSGGETVDISVNGSTTTDVTSPFAVSTTDGETYDITVTLNSGMSAVDTDMTNFSVGSLNTVANITALIADVNANGLGRFYEITGGSLVTHTDGFNNRRWIQDTDISGILIYDETDVITTPYAVGDLVTGLKGTTEQSNGILRFIPTEDSGVISSSGNTVTPQIVTITAFNAAPDDYESELIEIENVTFVDGDGIATFATAQNYDLTDGSNTVIKRTDFFSADYIGELIPTSELSSVVGVAGEFNGTAQIYLRDLNDFVLSVDSFDRVSDDFAVFPNPTNTGFINITSSSNTDISAVVFDVLGKQVISETLNDSQLNVSGLNSGIYIIRIEQNNTAVTKKLVIE
ncbi:T9SS type A sorting domain-containing protein [uncultured Aquimarina sp.]|uniref:T9SS type A sorting domain-containing protein n=1 Tax=uncultured Aquimarina sp. TaxID=575652 RepID=UPI00261AC04B|nr:T9SS type A sorting domain-containing protein [uncultured Aquimarina sp.]